MHVMRDASSLPPICSIPLSFCRISLLFFHPLPTKRINDKLCRPRGTMLWEVPPAHREHASDTHPDLKLKRPRFALPPNVLCNFPYFQPSNSM